MTIEADPLRGNAVLVDALGSALRRGGNALGSVPDLLKRVLREESWREFATQRGELVRHDRFADFVTTAPLKGIGASVDLIRRIVTDDVEAVDLLDRALQNPAHHHTSIPGVDNVHVTERPAGNAKDAALRRLRKDAPELHADVIAGNLSAHAAMVKAGFRPKTFTVRADDATSAAHTIRKHMNPDDIARLVAILGEPS